MGIAGGRRIVPEVIREMVNSCGRRGDEQGLKRRNVNVTAGPPGKYHLIFNGGSASLGDRDRQ